MISGTGLILALGLVALLGLAAVIVWRVYRTPPSYRRGHQEDLPLFSVSLVESSRTPAPTPSARPRATVATASPNGAAAVSRASAPAPARPHSVPPVQASAPPLVTAPSPRPAATQETFTPSAPTAAVRDARQSAAPASKAPEVERRAEDRPVMQAASAAPMISADGVPGTQIEGHLLRFSVPQDGTLQFLPGRLEILNGLDVGREVRFVRVPGADGTNVSFGRSEGPAYRHVQLREGTVSRQHARMELRDSQWHLTNLSATNPVVYNEQVLAVGEERLLMDGDRIEMGEVVFGFRSR